jgi:hypothetical protein
MKKIGTYIKRASSIRVIPGNFPWVAISKMINRVPPRDGLSRTNVDLF